MKTLKTIVITLAFSLSFLNAFSQNDIKMTTIKRQPINIPNIEFGSESVVATSKDAFFITLQDYSRNNKFIVKYDKDLKFQDSIRIKTNSGKSSKSGFGTVRESYVKSIIGYNGGIVVLMNKSKKTTWDKMKNSQPKGEVFVYKYDNNLNLVGQPEKKGIASYCGDRNGYIYGFIKSPDESKILFYQVRNLSKDSHSLYFECYDNSFKLLWKKEIVKNYKSKLMKKLYLSFENNEDVVFSSTVFINTPSLKNAAYYNVISLTKNGESVNEVKIADDQRMLLEPIFWSNNDGFFILGNYSQSKSGDWSSKGTYFIKADNSLKNVEPIKFSEFPTELIAKYEERKENETEVENLMPVDVYKYSNGNIAYVTQQKLTVTKDNVMFIYLESFYVTCYDPDGNVLWIRKVPRKSLYSGNFTFIISSISNIDDILSITYMDSESNFKEPEDGNLKWDKANSKVTITAEIDSDGKMKKMISAPRTSSRKSKVPSDAILQEDGSYYKVECINGSISLIKCELK